MLKKYQTSQTYAILYDFWEIMSRIISFLPISPRDHTTIVYVFKPAPDLEPQQRNKAGNLVETAERGGLKFCLQGPKLALRKFPSEKKLRSSWNTNDTQILPIYP